MHTNALPATTFTTESRSYLALSGATNQLITIMNSLHFSHVGSTALVKRVPNRKPSAAVYHQPTGAAGQNAG